MENFSEIASRFVAADAAIQVESPEDAGVAWIELLRNPERRNKMAENAKRLVDSSRGPPTASWLRYPNSWRFGSMRLPLACAFAVATFDYLRWRGMAEGMVLRTWLASQERLNGR